jgi:hypothetical protein
MVVLWALGGNLHITETNRIRLVLVSVQNRNLWALVSDSHIRESDRIQLLLVGMQ